MTKIIGNFVAVCMIVMGLGALLQVKAFAKLRGEQARRLPIGERQYVLDSEERYAPVEIQSAREIPSSQHPESQSSDLGRGHLKVLRDPVRPGEESKQAARNTRKKAAEKVEYKVLKGPAKARQLRFGKLAVNGKLVEPRVKFERTPAAIRRVEEPTKAQFFQKISEATNDW